MTTLIASSHQLAEQFAEITNLKILEVYRETPTTALGYAKVMDDHLNDLGKRIVEALEAATVPSAPDMYEVWLLENKKNAQLNKESNESPTTDQKDKGSEPETARVDNVSGSPVSGGDPDTPDQDERGPGYLKALVEAWKISLDCSNMKLATLAGVSDPTIGQILHGRKVSDVTRDKVLEAIEKHETSCGVMAVPEKLNGSGDQDEAGAINSKLQNCDASNNDAGRFIQLQLNTWARLEHLGVKTAAKRLSVKESVIRSINAGKLPHPNIVRQLAKYIPAIEAQQSMLMHAAEHREAA